MDAARTAFEQIRRDAHSREDVLGLVVTGSRGKGFETEHSDYDCVLIVRDHALDTFRQKFAPLPEGVELWVVTMDEFRGHAAIGSEFEWDRYNWAHLKADPDRTGGEIQRIIDEKGRVPEEHVDRVIRASLDAYINQVYRSIKCLRDGDLVGHRLGAADSIRPLLRALFCVHDQRVMPYYKYLEWELANWPLDRLSISGEELIERVMAILTTGDYRAQQELLREAEQLFRAAGFGEVFDSWKGKDKWARTASLDTTMANPIHEANRRRWNTGAAGWKRTHDRRDTWRVAHQQPEAVFLPRELEFLGNLAGKKACVLGSGDNLAAFALAGMGAKVTSVDISEKQLEVAEQRASELGLELTFVRADVTDLPLPSRNFSLVYTGGHVAVWVSDLRRYYAEAIRILRSGGLFLINEYHPFRRLWADHPEQLIVEYPYFERGPHYYDASDDVLDRTPGELASYEFHWTMSDFLKAVMEQGCELLAVDEFGDSPESWEGAALGGLPNWLLIAARKT